MDLVRLLCTIFVVVCAMGFSADRSFADTRVALVIGNGAYENAPRLTNPASDAAGVAAALRRAGFETILATDLTKAGTDEAMIRFARAARTADVAMFYYSGHALQFAGVNYLAPVDIELNDEADLRRMTRVDEVVADLTQAKNLRILVLDACRDNPLAVQLKRSIGASRAIPLQRGLAKIDSPEGMIVAYATQAGRTAEDGDGRNSPYTTAFLKHIDEKEEVGSIFRRISSDVYETTKHEQLPELSLSLIGEFYLNGKADDVVKVPANPAITAPAPSAQSDVRRDYELALQLGTRDVWIAFLAQYPDGLYGTLAKGQLNKIASEEARLAATEKARVAQEEKERLAAEGAKQAEQAGAAAKAKAAEEARLASERAKQIEQAKVAAGEQARVAAEKDAADKVAEARLAKVRAEKVDDAGANAQEPKPPQQVASLPPEGTTATQEPSPQDIARSVQRELKRVGCFAGSIDGEWNSASQHSLEMFNRRAGTKFDVKVASIDMRDAITARTSRVCPLICKHGYTASDDACKKITCNAGYQVGDDNECERSAAKRPSAARFTQRKEIAQPQFIHRNPIAQPQPQPQPQSRDTCAGSYCLGH